MKTFKKLGFGLVLLATTSLLLSLSLGSKKAHALGFTAADIKNATYTFQDGANISAKFNFSSSPVIFTDRDSTDGTRNYLPVGSASFCDPGDISDRNGLPGNTRYGISIGKTVNLSSATIPGVIKIGYLVGSNCDKTHAVLVTINIANPNKAATSDFQWDNGQIKSLNGSSHSATLSLKPNTNNLVYTEFGDSCGSGDVILLDSAGGNSGRLYQLSPAVNTRGGSPGNIGGYPAIAKYFDASSCRVESGPVSVTIAGSPGSSAATGSGTNATSGDSCELNSSGFGLSWLMCPLLASANDLINGSDGKGNGGLLGLYQDQLSFNVNKDLGVTGGTGSNKVQTTWSLIKNISSAVIVIVLLIMIFSQAIGSGPFDAYTIRKTLPRLVAAVILMQLSWYITVWIVDLVNDIGNSLFDLLYAPFGGTSNMGLGSLFANANIGVVQAGLVSWVGLVGALALGLAALPAVMLAVLSVVAALFTALVVLIFRKIIIIFCLIFAPLAILAWVLPGTQRYWKLWYNNFLKVLFMFPIVVGMIAAGHIFAYVVGTQGNGTFLNMIFIIIGVFGPLFLLPKAYKWGGEAMAASGGAISGAINRFGGKESALGKGIQGYGERWQGAKAKQYNPQSGLRNRALRRVQSGHMLPTERSRRLTIAAGNKWASERSEEAEAFVGRTYEKALNKYDKVDMDEDGNYVQVERLTDGKGNYFDISGNAVAMSDAAFVNKDGTRVEKFKDADKTIVEDRNKATSVQLTGVAAAKQALVDIAGNDDQSDAGRRAAQAAHKQLIDTSSWIELQKARIQGGNNKGRRIFEVDSFTDTLENSPPHYSATIKSRPDVAPDVIESAQTKLRITYDEAYETGDKVAIHALDKERLMTTLARLGPDAVSSLHFGIFEDIDKLNDAEVSNLLADRLKEFRDSGTTIGSNAIGSLTGQAMKERVDAALSHANNGDPTTLDGYLPGPRRP